MQGDMVNDPDMIAENERLSRWVNAWRMSLVSWWVPNESAFLDFMLNDIRKVKLGTECI